ncbi:ComF family protein [Oceanobacillus sp. Castelsardo]|uniref:ComF family protein n=1 Tax=Oceanobacillus sp. Castelsardo TaxID=1851204 RepID=UPI000837AB96|nr:ComF family protein [Oceanobacillus sp. Castelsardo]
MNCAWCDTEIILQLSWANLMMLEKAEILCPECKFDLEWIQGNRCDRCSRNTNEKRCTDCQWWEKQKENGSFLFNYSIFSYNPFMKEVIAKWKYRGDYYLGYIFENYVMEAFREKFSFLKKEGLVVPIPLSEERLLERGFNQAKMIADFLPLETKELLTRLHGEKQSKKSRKERILTGSPFFITETINKPVLLVDDIYTTGTTLRHAARLLMEHGCPSVYALTLVRG